MASPPNYTSTSPPAPPSLSLPRQRPTLSLPTANAVRRKYSVTSTTSSSHPLRQTSFPPADRYGSPGGGGDLSAVYSPTDSADFSESEITSAISGPAGEIGDGSKKRKRGDKRGRGRPPKNPRQGSQSVVNGTDDGKRRSAARGETAGAGDADAEEDDEDEDEDGAGADRAGAYEQDRFIANDRARIDLHQQMSDFQQERHDSWHRAKLKTADVRRLVNQTLSQSVPANVVTVVQAYTKMFAGLLIEGAREVQSEWMAVEAARADGRPNPAAQALGGDTDSAQSTQINTTQATETTQQGAEAQEHEKHVAENDDFETDLPPSRAMGIRKKIAECDRGPLLADHLRESLRRYKKSRYGGVVGFTGLSLEGRDVAAVRNGGRRLFR